MNRLLIGTAAAVLLGLTPALAADNSAMQPPTQSGVTHDTAKSAAQPESGSADTSGGAAEQSSAPPASGAASANKTTATAAKPKKNDRRRRSGKRAAVTMPPARINKHHAVSDPQSPSLGIAK